MNLRIGVTGMGFMGGLYAAILSTLEGVTLAGVCDPIAPRAAEAGERFGVPAYTATADLLDRAALQALCICAPEQGHTEPGLLALQRGVAVLVEKPLASTLDDCTRLCAAAERGNALLTVGHLLRFDYRYAQLHEAVASGTIGRIESLHARRWNTRGAQLRLHGRSSLPLFLGVHDYDLVRWIAGAEVVRVVAEGRRRVLAADGYNTDDTVVALLSVDNGALACVESGWIMPDSHPSGFVQRLDALGTHGMLSLEGSDGGVVAIDAQRASWPDTALWPQWRGTIGGALERQLRSFVACVAHDREPVVSGQDGLAAVTIALAVEEAARTGQAVTLTHGH